MLSAIRPSWARFSAPGASIIAAYAAMVLIWGTTWLGIKFSLGGLPPLTGAGTRFVIAGAAFYLIALAMKTDLRKAAPPAHLVIVLAFTMFGLTYALTYLAETHLSSGLVAVLFGTMPFFVYAFAHVLLGERASPRMLFGALLALAGVGAISLSGNFRASLVYIAAALLASAGSAFANVYLKRYAEAEPLATLPPAMLLGGALMLASGLLFEHLDIARAVSFSSIASILYLAAGGSVIAYYLNHWLLQRVDSGTVGLSALMIPVVAVSVGVLFGGEVLRLADFAGAGLVLLGSWLALASPEARPLEPAA
jgi:drug/metabolite transporter (DMT)-like permease